MFSESTFTILMYVVIGLGIITVLSGARLALRKKRNFLIGSVLQLGIVLLVFGLFHYRVVGVDSSLVLWCILMLPVTLMFIIRSGSELSNRSHRSADDRRE